MSELHGLASSFYSSHAPPSPQLSVRLDLASEPAGCDRKYRPRDLLHQTRVFITTQGIGPYDFSEIRPVSPHLLQRHLVCTHQVSWDHSDGQYS